MNDFTINLKVSLDSEALSVLERIASALEGRAPEVAPSPVQDTNPAMTQVEDMPLEVYEPAPAKTIGINDADLIKQVSWMIQNKKTDKVKVSALLGEFGVSKVTALPADKRDAFMSKLCQ